MINGLSISDCRRFKELKKTKSWCTNLLLKIHYALKQKKLKCACDNPKEFAKKVSSICENQNIRVEKNGMLVFIDSAPESDENTEQKKAKARGTAEINHEESANARKDKFSLEKNVLKNIVEVDGNQNIEEEKKGEEKVPLPDPADVQPFQFEKYFEQQVPLRARDLKGKKAKHVYTVEITRAMFTEESFEVYKKYQKYVHNREDTESYDSFICQVPLFDPTDVDIP